MLWRQDNSPAAPKISTIMSSPPPPRHPVAADTMAVLVVGVMVNYILPLRKRALLPPNAKRPARIY
jgi:hypothetical protein